MRRAVVLAPLLSLALFLDRSLEAPPPRYSPDDLTAAMRALPGRNEGRLGREGDALNLLFLGSEGALAEALGSAGWTQVPRSVVGSFAGGLGDLWLGRALARFPPMNDYRFMGRRQDMNWAIPLVPIQSRHHFRVWRTGVVDRRGRELWWGSGDFDLSVRWIDLSHRPDPDMDVERDAVAGSLKGSALVEAMELVALPQIPRQGRNDKGYPFKNDGRALLVTLAR